MRIGIVNDLKLAVTAMQKALEARPQHKIAWIVGCGAEALEACKRDRPDLVLMDLLMPGMDGVEATRRIMAEAPCAILVVTATVSGNIHKVFEAMSVGALDAVETPSLGSLAGGVAPGETSRPALLAKIDTMSRLLQKPPAPRWSKPGPTAESGALATGSVEEGRSAHRHPLPLVAIGASAGGPAAVAEVLAGLGAGFPVAIALVQHVDEQYAAALADWLQQQTGWRVRLAAPGESLVVGEVCLAARSDHLVLQPGCTLAYRSQPHETFYRPSIDVFFQSIASCWKGAALGVILTGMGRDGASGLVQMREAGFHTIAQDEATSAVYGMPKAAAQMGAAAKIAPLNAIAGEIRRWAQCLAHK